MKLTSLALFGAGYVMGTRAGRERYQEILAMVGRAAQGLEHKSARDRILEYANEGAPLSEVLRTRAPGGVGRANGSTTTLRGQSTGQQPTR